MDAIADDLGKDRAEVRARQLHPARRVPLRPGADLPGRPAARATTPATTRPRWRSSRSWSAGTSSRRSGREMAAPRAGRSASAWPATSRAPASGPYEGAHVHVETSGKVKVATGLTTQGQGHQTVFAQIVADELGVPLRGRRGGHRRHPPDAVRRRHVRLAGRGDERVGDPPRGAAGRARRRCGSRPTRWRPSEDDLEIVDGVVSVQGRADVVDRRSARSRCCPTRCATPSTRRRRRPPSSRVGDPGKPPVAEDDEPGLEGTRLLLARAVDVRLRHARGDRRDRPATPPRSRSSSTPSSTTAGT